MSFFFVTFLLDETTRVVFVLCQLWVGLSGLILIGRPESSILKKHPKIELFDKHALGHRYLVQKVSYGDLHEGQI